jgi:hypothetical protein
VYDLVSLGGILFLKTNFGLEKYLTLINNFNYRKSICRFRVSAHRLYIETGRYKNIPRNERYELTQIYKMYIKILRHGKIKRKNNKLVNSNLRHVISCIST